MSELESHKKPGFNPVRSKRELAAYAREAVEIGDLEEAAFLYRKAIESDRRNGSLHFQLAVVEEALDNIHGAVVALTRALSLKPQLLDAGWRLARLLMRYRLDDLSELTAGGLRAALAMPGIAHQPVAEVALQHLFQRYQSLRAITASDDPRAKAAAVLKSEANILGEPLLLQALAGSVVRALELERTLTVFRAALLDCPPERFDNRDLAGFALALMEQGWNNDHAWPVSAEETARLEALVIDRAALLAGDRAMGWKLVQKALYMPLHLALGAPLAAGDAHLIRPKQVREVIEPRIQAEAIERAIATSLPRLKPLSDATSLRVAGQYEQSPYPRWQSLHKTPVGLLRSTLQAFVPAEKLAFMDKPFDCLIAGCGTGQHALQSAVAYGPDARVLALDLSTASLAYAAARARDFSVGNVTFLHGDILDLDGMAATFDVIECVGVLHHMGDPWAGWRALRRRLKPGGLMYIGLYSATSRKALRDLRSEPGYPGPGCTDAAARAYRAELLARADDAPGGDLKFSRNAYALSEFRDLVLHEQEIQMTLSGIAGFLREEGLAFRGFTISPEIVADFAAANPGADCWPGTLDAWSTFESTRPRTFDGMYRFWCEAV